MSAMLLFTLGTAAVRVWPPPQHIATSGSPLILSDDFEFRVARDHVFMTSTRLARGRQRALYHMSRTPTILQESAAGYAPLRSVELRLSADAQAPAPPSASTRYDYKISIDRSRNIATATAASEFGLLYAMETLSQLAVRVGGANGPLALAASSIDVTDAPAYAWRGLMLDSGRRFVPLKTVYNLVDTMAANKLNVLHLHASDMCRFGVESKLFPNLTSSLAGAFRGYYSQDDIKAMIAYADDRGVRVVPEFDVPGHSRGFRPVKSAGLRFCDDGESQSQLYDDPDGATYKVVLGVMREMAALFSDQVFDIGCDETSAKGPCSVKSTFAFERRLLSAVQNDFNKTPSGWEEVLFDAGAATNGTIVDAWSRHSASEVTATGRRAIESKSGAFYFTRAAPGGPEGWSKCWYDIASGVPSDERSLLLGGEMSMWTDTYCVTNQCGASGGGAPVGSALFSPDHDDAFAKSIGGMIWPRGYVGAAAFWNFNSSADPSSSDFVAGVWAQNDRLAARGAFVCPTNCSCDQLSACGTPYLAADPPRSGDAAKLAECALANSTLTQSWLLQPAEGGAFTMRALANASLCLTRSAADAYPLELAPCADGARSQVFERRAVDAEIVHVDSGSCLDLRVSDGLVGTWECGPTGTQPNQHWAYDEATHRVVSMASGTGYAGFCLGAEPQRLM